MTNITRSIPLILDIDQLATDIRSTLIQLRLTNEEAAELAGISASTVKALASAAQENPHVSTVLATCNALDLDARKYFVLR